MTSYLFNKLASLREVEVIVTWGGVELSKENSMKIRDSYLIFTLVLLDLAEPQSPDYVIFSQAKQWLLKMCSQDVVKLEKSFKDTWVQINSTLHIDIDFFMSTFKEYYYEPSQAGHLLVPFQWFQMGKKVEDDKAVMLDVALRSFISYFLTFPFKVNLDLDIQDELIREYKEVERLNRAKVYDPNTLFIMNDIIKEWLRDCPCDFASIVNLCQHGPGAVADIKRRQEATSAGKTALLSAHTCFPEFPEELLMGDSVLTESEIVFVPKSMKTYRTISKEPATLQFFQQGVSRVLSNHLNKSVRGINLERQDLSRSLAREASVNGKYATIDLSSASDTVTITLVRSLFADTAIEDFVIGLRSTHTLLPNGEAIELEKYAPMGSALCFPVETLVFSAVCEYCTRLSGYRFDKTPYRVYGDDIICHQLITEDVLDTLTALGFLVNTSKSYYSETSRFREACGGEYYRGYDITPVRLPRNFPGLRPTNLKEVSCLVDLANRFHDSYLRSARRLIIQIVSQLGYRIPFSSSGEIGFKTNNPTNFHLKRVYRGTWKVGVKHHVLVSRSCTAEKGESNYCDWTIRKYCDPESQCYTSETLRPVAVKSWKITPLYTLKQDI